MGKCWFELTGIPRLKSLHTYFRMWSGLLRFVFWPGTLGTRSLPLASAPCRAPPSTHPLIGGQGAHQRAASSPGEEHLVKHWGVAPISILVPLEFHLHPTCQVHSVCFVNVGELMRGWGLGQCCALLWPLVCQAIQQQPPAAGTTWRRRSGQHHKSSSLLCETLS